jgi:hypothetical protein
MREPPSEQLIASRGHHSRAGCRIIRAVEAAIASMRRPRNLNEKSLSVRMLGSREPKRNRTDGENVFRECGAPGPPSFDANLTNFGAPR